MLPSHLLLFLFITLSPVTWMPFPSLQPKAAELLVFTGSGFLQTAK